MVPPMRLRASVLSTLSTVANTILRSITSRVSTVKSAACAGRAASSKPVDSTAEKTALRRYAIPSTDTCLLRLLEGSAGLATSQLQNSGERAETGHRGLHHVREVGRASCRERVVQYSER